MQCKMASAGKMNGHEEVSPVKTADQGSCIKGCLRGWYRIPGLSGGE